MADSSERPTNEYSIGVNTVVGTYIVVNSDHKELFGNYFTNVEQHF